MQQKISLFYKKIPYLRESTQKTQFIFFIKMIKYMKRDSMKKNKRIDDKKNRIPLEVKMDTEMKRTRGKKEVSFLGLFGKKFLEETQQKLKEATGVSFSIIDYKGDTVTEGNEEEKFCIKRKKEGERCKECQMSRAFAAAKSAIKNFPYLFSCPEGMMHMAIPVVVNNQYLGAVIGGPIRCEERAGSGDLTNEDKEILKNYSQEKEYQLLPDFTMKKLNASADMVFLLFKEMAEKETIALQVGTLEHKEVHLADIRRKTKVLEEKLHRMEQDNLIERMPKQLLLNLLTTISSFAILENARKTETVIAELSSVLRYYLDAAERMVFLHEELKQVKLYLGILREQYADRLEYKINCQKEVEKQEIPVLSILPFVEHMVDFGIIAGHFRGTVYIDAEKYNEYCKITIQMESSGLPLGHFGSGITDSHFMNTQTQNIEKRFRLEYGENFELSVAPGITVYQIPFGESRKR